MKVRHAKLIDVIGRAAKFGGFAIVPAELEFEGQCSRPFPLNELPRNRIPPVLRIPMQEHFDVAWVRARLPHAFGIAPEPAEDADKAMLAVGFVAIREGADEGIAFECYDHYGKTSLIFSEDEQVDEMKQVADAFWSLLLSEPDQLADFEARFMHSGAGVWVIYGCEDGEPYCGEADDED